jgi:hypothetical protein
MSNSLFLWNFQIKMLSACLVFLLRISCLTHRMSIPESLKYLSKCENINWFPYLFLWSLGFLDIE